MPRRPRLDHAGAIHHVMNRGVDRQRIFFSDVDRIDFGAQLGAIHEQFGATVIAYCLMDNHYHLLLRTPGGELAACMHHLSVTFTRHVNDRVGRDGPLFRGRYHSILVDSDVYLMWAARYIHRNPLDMARVDTPGDYRWSSYRSYRGWKRGPEFLDQSLLLGLFDGDRERWATFTDGETGSASGWAFDDAHQLVQFAIADDDIRHDDDAARRRLTRTLLTLLIEAPIGASLALDIERALAFPSPSAARMARHRARVHASDPVVARILRQVISHLGLRALAA